MIVRRLLPLPGLAALLLTAVPPMLAQDAVLPAKEAAPAPVHDLFLERLSRRIDLTHDFDAPAPALTLREFLARVTASNLDLAAQRFNVSIAKAQLAAARVTPNPTLSYGFSHDITREQQPTTFNGGISELIENGGKRAARIGVAQRNILAASATLEDFFRTLRGAAATAYVNAAASQMIVKQKQRAYKSLNDLADLNKFRYSAGDLAEVDYNQARVDALQAQGDLISAEASAKATRFTLVQFLGKSSAPVPEPESDLQVGNLDFDLSKLVADALQRRPDVIAARESYASAQASIRLARANRYPDLTLGVTLQENQRGRNPIDPSPNYNFVGLTAAVPLPIFNSFRGEYRVAQQTAFQTEKVLHSIELKAELDVRGSYAQYQYAKARAAKYQGAVIDLAGKVLAARLLAYKQGGATLLDVLAAQKADTDVRLALIDALTQRANALIALEQAAFIWNLDF